MWQTLISAVQWSSFQARKEAPPTSLFRGRRKALLSLQPIGLVWLELVCGARVALWSRARAFPPCPRQTEGSPSAPAQSGRGKRHASGEVPKQVMDGQDSYVCGASSVVGNARKTRTAVVDFIVLSVLSCPPLVVPPPVLLAPRSAPLGR